MTGNFLAPSVTFRDFMAGNFMAGDFLAGDFMAHRVSFGDFMAGTFLAGDFLGGYHVEHLQRSVLILDTTFDYREIFKSHSALKFGKLKKNQAKGALFYP